MLQTKPSDRIDDSSLDNSGSVDNLSRDDLQDLKGLIFSSLFYMIYECL